MIDWFLAKGTTSRTLVFLISDKKKGTSRLTKLAILRKKGTLGSQWQSLINSRISNWCSSKDCVWPAATSTTSLTCPQAPTRDQQEGERGKTFGHFSTSSTTFAAWAPQNCLAECFPLSFWLFFPVSAWSSLSRLNSQVILSLNVLGQLSGSLNQICLRRQRGWSPGKENTLVGSGGMFSSLLNQMLYPLAINRWVEFIREECQ